MSITVTQINSPDDQPEDLQALVEVCDADRAVRDPDDPPISPAEITADVFVRAPGSKGVVFVAHLDGVAAGAAWTFTESEPGDENQVSFVEVLVKPELQRQGVAIALLEQVVPSLIQLSQNSILVYVCAEVAHEAAVGLCQKLHLTPRLEERCSRVDVGQIDEELMGSWIADAEIRAEGYRLEQWEGVCPEPL
ncbi:MAG: GNAT family N-acetyltransferase, partial [Actinomycetia bacterium]|nr:GNAT family N-acetyltransferase [Actinomycetes bacterium]